MDQLAKLPTTARGLKIMYREFKDEIRRRNAERAHPLPLCAECCMPIAPGDEEWLFRRRCTSCAMTKLDRMIQRIAKRIGRKRTIRALNALAYRD